MGAKAVTVVTVNEEAGETSSDQLVAHLGRRGIAARTQRLTADRGDIRVPFSRLRPKAVWASW